MSIYKSPFLEPYTGRFSRHSCPRCKQNQSFTLYINVNANTKKLEYGYNLADYIMEKRYLTASTWEKHYTNRQMLGKKNTK